MSKSTISTFELFQMFPDADSARTYFEQKRWPTGAICLACNEFKRIHARKDGKPMLVAKQLSLFG